MQNIVLLNDQNMIYHHLLEETIREYASIPGKRQGDIVIGASGTAFSFRNSGRGILAGEIARGVLPAEDGVPPTGKMSRQYDLEPYLGADVF